MARRKVGSEPVPDGDLTGERLDDAARACADGMVGDPAPEVLARAKELGLTPVIPERPEAPAEAPPDIHAAVKGFFGGGPHPGPNLKVPPPKESFDVVTGEFHARDESDDFEGDELTFTRGEEMYGQQGTFSSYRVGPFALKTRVRRGETPLDAARRAQDALDAVADQARVSAKAAFLGHYPVAFK